MKIFRGKKIDRHDIITINKKRCILIQQGGRQCFDCALNHSITCAGFPCSDFYPKEIKGGI